MTSEKISRRTTYEPSEDIYQLLEQYRKKHKTDGFKETIEGLIHSLLETTAEKPAEGASASLPEAENPSVRGTLPLKVESQLKPQQAQQPSTLHLQESQTLILREALKRGLPLEALIKCHIWKETVTVAQCKECVQKKVFPLCPEVEGIKG